MITATYAGHERVEYDGQVYTGPNAEGDLARALIGAGIDPAEKLVFNRDGKPALQGTIGAFAARAWAGADADPQFRRWRPHPDGQYAPLLMEWHAKRPPPAPRGRPGRVAAKQAPSAAIRSKEAPPETRAYDIKTNKISSTQPSTPTREHATAPPSPP